MRRYISSLFYFTVSMIILAMFPIQAEVVGHWRFEEGSGDSLYDESGYNNHGVIHGPVWCTGMHNGALEFDGIDDNVIIPHSVSLASPVNTITMEAWIYPYTYRSEWNHILNKFGIYTLSIYDTLPAMAVRVGSHVWWQPVVDKLPTNEWIYFVGTFDGQKERIFINGTMTVEDTLTGVINEGFASDNFEIGGSINAPLSSFKGKIDEICIFNTALTASEIQSRYQNFISPVPRLIAVPSPTYNRIPVLRWYAVDSAVSYTIQIDTTTFFALPIVSLALGDTAFTPLSDLPRHTIYWRVATGQQPIAYSPVSSFVIQDSLIPIIIHYTPNPTCERRPTFTWHSVTGASNYHILADNDLSFLSPEISISVEDTFFIPLADLPVSTLYWKVKSDLLDTYSVVSSVIIQSDTIPFLYSFGGAEVPLRRPVFKWKPVTGATTYKIEIDTVSSFTSRVITLELGDTTFTPLSDLDQRMYYWHVSCSRNPSLFSPTDSLRISLSVAVNNRERCMQQTSSLAVYPNPCSGSVNISVQLPVHEKGFLSIYCVDGTLLKQFSLRGQSCNNHITWNGRDTNNRNVAEGVYLITLQSESRILKQKILFMK